MFCRTEVTSDKIRLNSNAHQKPSTLNPSTNLAVINIIIALITNKNKPRDKMVTGIVKTIMIGLMTLFRNDSTAATINAVRKLLLAICTPGKT